LNSDGSPGFNCYRFATSAPASVIVKSIYRCMAPHREPLAVRIHGELDAGMTQLPLYVCRAFTLLE
jgi:hypothetical protein